jgi:hypothetical protein
VPVDFNALFQQYLSFMQRLAQQHAYALKWVAGVVTVCCACTVRLLMFGMIEGSHVTW